MKLSTEQQIEKPSNDSKAVLSGNLHHETAATVNILTGKMAGSYKHDHKFSILENNSA
uniref:Uncharacterized protein n=1 Tax=Arundo donax TaxID=35708 RepID=A0A0A9AXN7_ARUDO